MQPRNTDSRTPVPILRRTTDHGRTSGTVRWGRDAPTIDLRHDLVSILLAQLPGSCRIHTSATITIEDLERWDRQSPAPYDLIVGADGINSVTRTYTVGATALHDGGMTLYRGVADLPKMLDGETFILVTADDGCRLIAYPVSAPIARSGSSRINWVLLVPDRVYEGQTPVLGESQEAVRRILGSLIGNWALDFLDIEAMIEKSPTIKSDGLVTVTQSISGPAHESYYLATRHTRCTPLGHRVPRKLSSTPPVLPGQSRPKPTHSSPLRSSCPPGFLRPTTSCSRIER